MFQNKLHRSLLLSVAVSAILAAAPAGAQPASRGKVSGAPNGGATANNARQFRIGPGDVLAVDVWKEPEASAVSVTVRPDGKMSLPMIGEVQAADLTPGELEAALTTKYGEYVKNPAVTVFIKEMNSQRIYVIGEVKREGQIRLDGPMTVLQALAQAGGLTDYAKRKKIYVLRTEQGRQSILPFDYDAVVHGEKVDQNIVLLAGDTVIVPR